MKLRVGILALLMLYGVTAGATEAPPDESGQGRAHSAGQSILGLPGPALSVTTIDGKTIDLSKLYGRKPVYLKFWATWCVPCRQQMPGFEQDYEKLGKRIDFVAVNVGFNDTTEIVKDYRRELGLHMPIVVDDGRLAAALNLRVTPQHVVIGRDGRVLYVGHLADDRLQAAFQQALKEEGSATAGRKLVAERHFNVGDMPSELTVETNTAGAVALVPPKGDSRPRALVFFSPWCESYLAKSRPAASQACRRVREEVDALVPKGGVQWVGIASGLWASSNDLAEYQKKTGTSVPLTLDGSGQLFRAFGVREVPTVVLLDTQGRVVRKLGPEDHDLKDAIQGLTPHS